VELFLRGEILQQALDRLTKKRERRAEMCAQENIEIEITSILYFGIASSSYLLLAMTVQKSSFVVVPPPRNDTKKTAPNLEQFLYQLFFKV
jgi:hypothetical protein